MTTVATVAAPAALALLAAATGCARISLGEPEVSRTVIRSEDRVEVATTPQVRLTQDETRLTVLAGYPCAEQQYDTVRVVETRKRLNDPPGRDWAIGIGAVAVVGTGAGFLIDAESVHADETDGRTYNPYGPTPARVVGGMLLGIGAGLLVIPVVDAVRASGSETRASTKVEASSVRRRRSPARLGKLPRG